MKAIPAIGALVALVVSVFVLRIVLHSYTDHDYLDVFHLVVGISAVGASVLLARLSVGRRA